MTAPPRDVLAAAARQAIEDHDEWDAPHCFQTLRWDGEKLSPRTYVCIMPDVDPVKYPEIMARAVAKEFEKHPDEPAFKANSKNYRKLLRGFAAPVLSKPLLRQFPLPE